MPASARKPRPSGSPRENVQGKAKSRRGNSRLTPATSGGDAAGSAGEEFDCKFALPREPALLNDIVGKVGGLSVMKVEQAA